MTRAIEELKRYSSYRGTIAKICDEEKMVAMLAGQREGGNQ